MRRIRAIFATTWSIFCVACFGCAPKSPSETMRESRPEAALSVADCVALADAQAQYILDDFDARPESAQMGGPFRLTEYHRDVQEERIEGQPVAWILYELNRPVGFLGHPQHFAVRVFRDSG